MTRVRASAHSPPTSGTNTPSTLKNCFAGPGGAGGSSCCSRCCSRSATRSPAAPARSVPRRTVGSLTVTPVKVARRRAACWKEGRQVPKRTSRSWSRGVSAPGSRPSCSSRGKKARATLRADAIRTGELQFLAPLGLEAARARSPCGEGLLTVRINGSLLGRLVLKVPQRTGQGAILQHLRPQAVQACIQGRLDLGQGRARVLPPPGSHPRQCVRG